MTKPSAKALADPRGLRLGTASRAAADHAEEALRQLMSGADSPRPALQLAREADPGWVLPLLLEAGALLGRQQPDDDAQASVLLARAAPMAAAATGRERAHLAALQAVEEGRLHVALRAWDELLLEHPRDALALHWAHVWDRALGDAQALRLRPARALPEWEDADPLFPHVLALYASGLAECQQPGPAEDLGRRALELAARAAGADPDRARMPRAVHAVTHAMESQGRFDEGAAWLRQQQQRWTHGSRLTSHLWWHLALFRLEALDVAGTLRLADTHFCCAAPAPGLSGLDAASLFWRLRVQGVEVDALFHDLLRRWEPDPAGAGTHAATDWHVVLALLGAGERAQAEAWVARCAERVVRGGESARTSHAVSREAALPLMRALLAAERGQTEAAVRGLYQVHAAGERLGGSRVRRDLVAQTLMAVSAGGPLAYVGRALLNERCLAKPITPLTRYWADRLGVAIEAPGR